MKQSIALTAAWLLAATLNLHAQGSLTPPPGAPAPVMKTLDQLEARTPLVAGQAGVTVDGGTGAITITARGSYFLTGNLTTTGTASCINVGTHTVSIDLNGFTISRTTGTDSGSAGILISGATGQKVMIKNGFFVGGGTSAGFAAAIDTTDSTSGSVHVEDVHCFNVRNGIILNYEEARNTARNCSVEISGARGIVAEIVSGCVVRNTVGDAIVGDSVSQCSVRQESATFAGIGINASFSSGTGVVTDCRVVTSNSIGIKANAVMNCYARSGSGTAAIDATLVTSSVAHRSGGVAINATTANGCIPESGSVTATNKYNMP